MNYFDSFVKINEAPNERWATRLQELSYKRFVNSSTFQTDVEKENTFGEEDYIPIVARITSLVDAKTGQRVNDDFKKIIFRDFSERPKLGAKFRFSDNIWLAFSVDNIKSVTASAYLRRCNNTLNFQDKYGNIHREPCCIDYKSTETQLSAGETIAVPSGRIYVQCQFNDYTKSIDIDKRFIFGNFVYKVRYISDYDRQTTFDKDGCTFISFYADFDNKAVYDNFELGIADYRTYNYIISCDSEVSGRVGDTGNLSAIVKLDGQIVDEPLVYELLSPDNIISIDDNGNYELLSNGTATVRVSMKNSELYYTDVKFSVDEQSNDPYITPNVDTVLINQTIDYEIVYNEPLTITMETENPSYYYSFRTSGNSFSVSNYKSSDWPIHVMYSNDDGTISGKFDVYLGGIF